MRPVFYKLYSRFIRQDTGLLAFFIGRNAATRVHSNYGSSTEQQFDWEGRKINGNRKKTPRKCPFQGRNGKRWYKGKDAYVKDKCIYSLETVNSEIKYNKAYSREKSFICKIQREKFENIINNAWKHI